MPYVQKAAKPSFAKTLSEGAVGVANSIRQYRQDERSNSLAQEQLKIQQQHSQQQLDQWDQQKKQMELQIQQQRAQGSEIAHKAIAGMYFDAASSEDPKAFWDLPGNMQRAQGMSQLAGTPFDDKQAREYSAAMSKTIKPQIEIYNSSTAALGNPGLTDKAAEEWFKKGKAAMQQMVKAAPGMRDLLDAKQGELDAMYNARFKGRMAQKEAQIKAANKMPEPTEFQKVQDRKQAEAYAKAIDMLPKAKQSVTNLDNALGIMDRVFTGPLAGKSYAYGLQKIAKDDAQELEFYLSKENVQRVMEFAKEAGVRSIDTEQEQSRLLSSIANKEQSPKVLRKALLQMKSIQQEAISNTLAKDKYVKQHGNLQGFLPGGSTGEPTELTTTSGFKLKK